MERGGGRRKKKKDEKVFESGFEVDCLITFRGGGGLLIECITMAVCASVYSYFAGHPFDIWILEIGGILCEGDAGCANEP